MTLDTGKIDTIIEVVGPCVCHISGKCKNCELVCGLGLLEEYTGWLEERRLKHDQVE